MKIIAILFGMMLFAGVTVVSRPYSVAAQSAVEIIQGGVDKVSDGSGATDSSSAIQSIVNTLLFIIGAVAVVMLIYGGFKYITSSGESSAVTSAKNTILYAVIGLVVALLAYAIIGFVISSFSTGPSVSPQAPGTTTPPVQTQNGQVGPMP